MGFNRVCELNDVLVQVPPICWPSDHHHERLSSCQVWFDRLVRAVCHDQQRVMGSIDRLLLWHASAVWWRGHVRGMRERGSRGWTLSKNNTMQCYLLETSLSDLEERGPFSESLSINKLMTAGIAQIPCKHMPYIHHRHNAGFLIL